MPDLRREGPADRQAHEPEAPGMTPEDPLAPARGVMHGMVLGCAIWGAFAALILLILRYLS